MFFVITPWHKKNPNDWVALKPGTYTNDLRDPKHHILYDRDFDLLELSKRVKERKLKVTYGKAWGMGISKDYPIYDSKAK